MSFTGTPNAAARREAVLLPAGHSESLSVLGIEVEILLRGEQTGGAFTTYRVSAEPGLGPPPHMHLQEDESFYVLEGEFEVLCGDAITILGAGAFVFLPRNVPHAFRNVGQSIGRLLGIGTPAGHEKFFEEASRMAFPPDMEEAIAVCRRHGMEIVAPN